MQDIELKCRDCGENVYFYCRESRSFISRKALQINPQDVPNAAKPEKLKENNLQFRQSLKKSVPFGTLLKLLLFHDYDNFGGILADSLTERGYSPVSLSELSARCPFCQHAI